jgi:uncharacterized membrane protein
MQEAGRGSVIAASSVLGMGLGGLADGIIFHQLLQTHSMLSAKVDRTSIVGLETNMFWDGVFHASTWTLIALGLGLLWRSIHRKTVNVPTRILVGGLAIGLGLFNLVEGTINHHLLELHHVVENSASTRFDWAFLAFGGVLVIVGRVLTRPQLSPTPLEVL